MGVVAQRHALSALPPGKVRYPLYRRLGGSQGRSGRVRKIFPPPDFDPQPVQSSRCTDWIQRDMDEIYWISYLLRLMSMFFWRFRPTTVRRPTVYLSSSRSKWTFIIPTVLSTISLQFTLHLQKKKKNAVNWREMCISWSFDSRHRWTKCPHFAKFREIRLTIVSYFRWNGFNQNLVSGSSLKICKDRQVLGLRKRSFRVQLASDWYHILWRKGFKCSGSVLSCTVP